MKTFLVAVLQLGLLLQHANGEPYPTKLSTGLYPEWLRPPLFYDAFIPIIHEYTYPNWSLLDVTLRDWRTMCQTDEFSPSYTCPVFFYLERFIQRMQLEIVNQNTRKFADQIPAEVAQVRDKCSKIQRHFSSLLTSQTSLDAYIKSWEACPLQGQVVRKNITDYYYNIKELYKKILSKFESEFSTRVGSASITSDRIGPAFYVNHITSSQGLMMFNYWVEHQRWENAAKACALGQIPTTLVKPSNLTDALNTVEEEAAKQKFVLSIPKNEMGTYLIRPLTDCTFSETSAFTVRILVPVRRRTLETKLVRLQPIPFLLNDDADTYSICQVFDAQGTFIHDKISGYLVQADACQPDELCQIESPARTPIPNLCASSYFAGSLGDVKKYCRFQCERVIDGFYPKLPIFRQVAADTFTVTGNSNLELVVKCEGKRDQLINPGELGALEIILPCDCSLTFRSQTFYPEQPCGDKLSVKIIMPIQFFNEDFLAGNFSTTNFTIISNWEKGMMEPKFFGVKGGHDKGRADKIIEVQTDLDSGQTQTVISGKDGQENSGASSTVGIWVVLGFEALLFIAVILFVTKKFGLWKFGRYSWGDGGAARMSFSNPLAPSESQVDVRQSPRAKGRVVAEDHFGI